MRSATRDVFGIECARLSRAFEAMLSAAMANLLLHYGARLAAASVTIGPGGRVAAIAALEQERNAALAALRAYIRQERKEAIERARNALTHDRFHVSIPADRRSPLVRSREQVSPVGRPLPVRRVRRAPTHSGP
jgi:hypothetical protein